MTVLSAIKSAVLRTSGEQITAAFTSTDQVCLEMCDLVNEVADDIAKAADWRKLTKVHTLTTTGAEGYDLPADYDRMVLGSDVDDPGTWFWGYQPFESINEWMRYRNGGYQLIAPGGWIILDGQMKFYPAPSGQATFPYISNRWGVDYEGEPLSQFTRDDDTFLLSEKLLRLGLIWRWRDQKNMDYAEDMASYEKELALLQGRDKGAYVLATPRRVPFNASIAYTGRAFR